MSEWQETEYGKAPLSWSVLPLAEMAVKITDGAHLSPKPQMAGKYMCSVKDMTYDRFNFKASKLISEEDYVKLVKQGCQPKKEDLLISKDGANCLDLIFVYKQKEELVLLSSIAIVRLKPEYIPDFVRYFLLSPDCQYTMRNNYVSGSAIPRVVLKDFKKVPILVPPLNEQRSIVSVLSSLDDKIDLLDRQNKTLEAMAETLFRQWFVERCPEHAEVGAGDWKVGKIEDLFVLQRGFDLPLQNRISGQYPIFASSGFSGYHSEYKVKAPGITTGRSGVLGNVFLVLEDFWPLNTSLYIKEFKKATPLFAYYTLKNIDLNSYNAGSAVPTLNRNHVHEASVLIPPDILIQEFEGIASLLFKKINKNENQIRQIKKIRDGLLPKLMSGEVRVL